MARRLALAYCEMTNRDVEYVALSRDTSEADLKQRREIREGSSVFEDQCAVRAAVEGRVLLLEGIEKAERNVLPVLNNLLENREMQLEDGRFLMSPWRYDALAATHSPAEMEDRALVRVDERFRVVALGLPVPRYPGNPLDPPLRSRFQARDIRGSAARHATVRSQLEAAAAECGADPAVAAEPLAAILGTVRELNRAADTAQTTGGHVIEPSPEALSRAVRMASHAPDGALERLLELVYPYRHCSATSSTELIESAVRRFCADAPTAEVDSISATPVDRGGEHVRVAEITTRFSDGVERSVEVPAGGLPLLPHGALTRSQLGVLSRMMLSHMSTDICLVGPRGVGKSVLVNRFAELLGYEVQPVMVHKDMSARDLLQQRDTLDNGDTVRFTPAFWPCALLPSPFIVPITTLKMSYTRVGALERYTRRNVRFVRFHGECRRDASTARILTKASPRVYHSLRS